MALSRPVFIKLWLLMRKESQPRDVGGFGWVHIETEKKKPQKEGLAGWLAGLIARSPRWLTDGLWADWSIGHFEGSESMGREAREVEGGGRGMKVGGLSWTLPWCF
jgi:hypothetical protein